MVFTLFDAIYTHTEIYIIYMRGLSYTNLWRCEDLGARKIKTNENKIQMKMVQVTKRYSEKKKKNTEDHTIYRNI